MRWRSVCSVCVELVDRVLSTSLPEAEGSNEYCSWAYTNRRKARKKLFTLLSSFSLKRRYNVANCLDTVLVTYDMPLAIPILCHTNSSHVDSSHLNSVLHGPLQQDTCHQSMPP